MGYAFTMSADAAELFFQVCGELKADTEEERVKILVSMAKLGLLRNVVETKMSKEEYIDHLRKNFNVADLTQGDKNGRPTHGID